MSQQTILYTLSKLGSEIDQMKDKMNRHMDRQNKLMENMIRLLAPAFSQTDDDSIENELIEARVQGNE